MSSPVDLCGVYEPCLFKFKNTLVDRFFGGKINIVAHGLLIGTDSKQFWLQGLYVATHLPLMLVVMFWVMQLKFSTANLKKA